MGGWLKMRACISERPSLLARFFLVLMMIIFILYIRRCFHDKDLRSNLFKEEKDNTNQVRSKFDLKMSVGQFYKIRHIS